MKAVIVVHGIRTKKTKKTWPLRYKYKTYRTCPTDIIIHTEKYKAGFNAWHNHLFVNPKQAKALVVEVESLLEEFPTAEINFVGHSNGCNVIVSTIRILARKGIRVNNVVLIGSAVHSDVEKNGLADLLDNGCIAGLYSFYSDGDKFISWLEHIPGSYGSMGYKGLMINGSRYVSNKANSLLFKDFKHSDYFLPENITETIRLINTKLELV